MFKNELPHDVDAERSLIGSIIALDDQNKFLEVMDLLKPSDFYSMAHQTIWQVMSELFQKGVNFDVVTLKGEIVKKEADPKPTLNELLACFDSDTGLGVNTSHFVAQIKNKSILRQIIRMTNTYTEAAQLEDAVSHGLLQDIQRDVLNIADLSDDSRPSDAAGIIQELHAEMVKGAELGWKGLDTKFVMLDKYTGGLIPTQVWIVGAYTGTGKTFFLLQILLNVLSQGGRVVLFSTEMDRKMNMLRLIANLAGVGTLKILKGHLDDEEKQRVEEAQKVLSEFKNQLIIFDNVYTVEEIQLKVKKLQVQEGVNLVIVDYIQNLKGSESLYERMSNAATNLYRMAQETKVTLMIASQVAQTSAGWSNKEAIEFKGAGEIAAIADVAVWIKKGENGMREVLLRKVRHGSEGKFKAQVMFPSGRVIDLEQPKEHIEGIGDDGNVKGQI